MTDIPPNLVEEAQVITTAIDAGDLPTPETYGLAQAITALREHDDELLAIEVKEAFRLARALNDDRLESAAERFADGHREDAQAIIEDLLPELPPERREAAKALASPED